MKRFLIFLILFLGIIYLSSRYYFNTGLKVNEYFIESPNFPEKMSGLKIVHFSDTLYKSTKESLQQINLVIEKINEQNPDIIIFTGDLIKNSITSEEKEELTKLFSTLNCRLYKYAILGDHDTLDSTSILENSDFNVLNNTNEYLYDKDSKPIIITDGINISDEDYYKIVLIHKPDEFKNFKDTNINLVLAGHSLGGQIRLPFINGVIKKDGANTYINNYYKENDHIMYVSYGIGNDKTEFRFLNKPSINVYRLNYK